MSILVSKPKYNICDSVAFNLAATYIDCDGNKGELNQKATGEVVGIFCDPQCVSDRGNNWRYYIVSHGMKHVRHEYELSPTHSNQQRRKSADASN